MAVPPPLPHPGKLALRATLRAARRAFVAALGPDERAQGHAAIVVRLRRLPDHAGPLAGYAAIGSEPDILPLLGEAARQGRDTALPHIGIDRVMTFARWRPDVALERGALGIAQPTVIEPVCPAILLMPLLGFDRRGARIGQGGGYYDRWCAAHPDVLRIGIAWSVQEVPIVPVDGWDMPLHGIVTEREWIEI